MEPSSSPSAKSLLSKYTDKYDYWTVATG